MLISLLAAAMLAQAAAALPPKACRDDDHTNRCAPEVRARVVASLGMASAEAEAKAGVEAYRVFFVDGYGRDRPAIAFERRAGEAPKAVVYAEGRTIEAPVSATAWTQVKTRAKFADRALEPLPPPVGEKEFRLCLHAWVVSVEIAGAPLRDDGSDTVRTRTENACDSGLATQFAYELAALAVQQFPACEALKADKHRNDVERLAFCTLLHGDTAAAAELANQNGGRIRLTGSDPVVAWGGWMGPNATPELNWAGQIIKDGERREGLVAKFLATEDPQGRLDLAPARIEGLDSKRVRVTGRAYKYTDIEPMRDGADYVQTWMWDPNVRSYKLQSWTISAFKPAPYPQKPKP